MRPGIRLDPFSCGLYYKDWSFLRPITNAMTLLLGYIYKSVKRAIFQLTCIQKYYQMHYAYAKKQKYFV